MPARIACDPGKTGSGISVSAGRGEVRDECTVSPAYTMLSSEVEYSCRLYLTYSCFVNRYLLTVDDSAAELLQTRRPDS